MIAIYYVRTTRVNWHYVTLIEHSQKRTIKTSKNHKRVYRIYRELELNLRIKTKKRLLREKPELLSVPTSINQCWSMDFIRGITLRKILMESRRCKKIDLSHHYQKSANETLASYALCFKQ